MCDILKRAGRRAKWAEIWDSEIPVTHTGIWSTFDLVVFNVISGSFRVLCLKMACISKVAGRRVKQSEIWDSIGCTCMYMGTFDLLGFNVIQCTCLKMACILKKAGRSETDWNLGLVDTGIYMGYIWPCKVQGRFGVIRCTCSSKAAGYRAKLSEIWDSWILVTHIWGTFDFVGFKVIWGWVGVIRCTYLKMACTLKTTGRKAKRSEIWKDTSNIYMGYLQTFSVHGHFGVIRCTSILYC